MRILTTVLYIAFVAFFTALSDWLRFRVERDRKQAAIKYAAHKSNQEVF